MIVAADAALAQQNRGQQNQGQRGESQAQAQLPPALQAAVLSGNAQAVNQAINTLSGGNPQRAAELAVSVVTAAERMLNANPQAALLAAGAALNTVRAATVSQSSPSQTQNVLTTAARIFVAPQSSALQPQLVSLGSSLLSASGQSNNPTLVAAIANQVVSRTEAIAATNPSAAAQLASTAVGLVSSAAVTAGAPQNALNVVTNAARLISRPDVQAAAPQAVAAIATTSATVVSTPAVFQVSPQAALQVMSASYNAASAPGVVAANPGAANSITQTLAIASANPQIANAFAQAGNVIGTIISKGEVPDAIKTLPPPASTSPS